MLIAFRLALDFTQYPQRHLGNNTRWNVSQTNRTLRLVHMLPSRSRRTEPIHLKICWLNRNRFRGLRQRRHDHGGKRSVSSLVLVKRRDPNKSVNATLAGEVRSDIIAINAESGATEASAFGL